MEKVSLTGVVWPAPSEESRRGHGEGLSHRGGLASSFRGHRGHAGERIWREVLQLLVCLKVGEI